MGRYIIDGEFGGNSKITIHLGDKLAQAMLWEYASRLRIDPEGNQEFCKDLEFGLLANGYADDAPTYPTPEHGWTCFHCGENFKTWGGARDHFGALPKAVAACKIKAGEEKGLMMAMRRVEAQLARERDKINRIIEVISEE